MEKTAVIILNYNNYEETLDCIESIEKYNSANIKYIVVDNGSSRQESVDCIQKFAQQKFKGKTLYIEDQHPTIRVLPYFTLIASKTNDGYAQGNNKGLNLAFNDNEISHILIINNDVIFVEDIIPNLLSATKEINNCGLVSPILYKRDLKGIDYNCARRNPTNWELLLTFMFMFRNLGGFLSKKIEKRKILKNNNWKKKERIEIELPSGSCMLSTKDLWKKINGFDNGTFLYYEENILYKKILNLNLHNYLIPNCKCIHLGACSTSKSGNSSYKMTKIKVDSANYYLTHFGDMNVWQKIFYPLAKAAINIKLLTIKLIRG